MLKLSSPDSVNLMSTEELEKVVQMSSCGYPLAIMAKMLGYRFASFLKEYEREGSELRQAVDDGRVIADFNILDKQRDLAEKGNITAAQIFLKESRERFVSSIRDRILFGDEEID